MVTVHAPKPCVGRGVSNRSMGPDAMLEADKFNRKNKFICEHNHNKTFLTVSPTWFMDEATTLSPSLSPVWPQSGSGHSRLQRLVSLSGCLTTVGL